MTGNRDDEGHGAYVQRVRDETRRYVKDLLADNEKLRRVVATLESDKSSLLTEKMNLQEKALGLREELDRVRQEQSELRRRLADAEAESRQFSHQYAEVEEQNNNLANLYVASYQLHSTLDRAEVLAAIQEIVINLIGSEELAIYELPDGGAELQLVGSFGVDAAEMPRVPLGAGIIGKAAASGEPFYAGRSQTDGHAPREASLTACVPLRLGDKVMGAVAVFGLLPQKNGFAAVDYELFNLLATHAATALYVTRPR